MAELDRLRIPYEYGGRGGGIIARLAGASPGPRIALRAEMDALPCSEQTGLPFASTVPGRMHACGHDVHMAIVLGTAARLAADPPPGSVVLVFQPAEERGNGARIHGGRRRAGRRRRDLRGPRHHAVPRVGEIMVADGTITAHSDRFDIDVHGESGHGARPHEAIDAVVVTGLLITAIQSLVSRHVNPVSPSVVTIGSVHAGTGRQHHRRPRRSSRASFATNPAGYAPRDHRRTAPGRAVARRAVSRPDRGHARGKLPRGRQRPARSRRRGPPRRGTSSPTAGSCGRSTRAWERKIFPISCRIRPGATYVSARARTATTFRCTTPASTWTRACSRSGPASSSARCGERPAAISP